jgi:hypothetical protein
MVELYKRVGEARLPKLLLVVYFHEESTLILKHLGHDDQQILDGSGFYMDPHVASS